MKYKLERTTDLKHSQDESSTKEGTNIHFGPDGKKLCSYSQKICQQRRMDGYAYCIKHVLEDTTAPFQQCKYVSKQSNKRCTNPVSVKETDLRYCVTHKQVLGLMPKKNFKKGEIITKNNNKKRKSDDAEEKEEKKVLPPNRKKISKILKRNDIPHSLNYTTKPLESSDESDSSFGEESSDEEIVSSSESDDDFNCDAFLEDITPESDEDDYLKDALVTTDEEIIRRRREKIFRLLKIYKSQFKRLRDLLKSKKK